MIKTILMPTDFKIESLNTLKYALEDNVIFDINAILLHTEIPGNSITDLLFYSADTIIKERITPTFEEAISILRNHYIRLQSLSILIIHGNNQACFDNFLRANKVDEICLPASYKLQLGKRSFDPCPHLKGSSYPLSTYDWDTDKLSPEKDQLSELFKLNRTS